MLLMEKWISPPPMEEVLQLTVVMKDMYCVDQKTELVSLMDHGLDHHQSVSVSCDVIDECVCAYVLCM